MNDKKERAIIIDKLVVEKTGATMEEWFRHLDDLGARKMRHAEIFDLVAKTEGLKPLGEWNQNLLTTTYEWDRGLKERGQKEKGFEVGVSKTILVPVSILYNSWIDDQIRQRWLPDEEIDIRKATLNKSARITWSDGVTSLSVEFYEKGPGKSQIVVQHLKIPDSKMAREMKEYWGKKLEELKMLLEK